MQVKILFDEVFLLLSNRYTVTPQPRVRCDVYCGVKWFLMIIAADSVSSQSSSACYRVRRDVHRLHVSIHCAYVSHDLNTSELGQTEYRCATFANHCSRCDLPGDLCSELRMVIYA